jgi:hypothetical protein
MKIQLSQREVSQLIVNYLVENKLVKSKSVSIEYEISTGEVGNELSVFVEEN